MLDANGKDFAFLDQFWYSPITIVPMNYISVFITVFKKATGPWGICCTGFQTKVKKTSIDALVLC